MLRMLLAAHRLAACAHAGVAGAAARALPRSRPAQAASNVPSKLKLKQPHRPRYLHAPAVNRAYNWLWDVKSRQEAQNGNLNNANVHQFSSHDTQHFCVARPMSSQDLQQLGGAYHNIVSTH